MDSRIVVAAVCMMASDASARAACTPVIDQAQEAFDHWRPAGGVREVMLAQVFRVGVTGYLQAARLVASRSDSADYDALVSLQPVESSGVPSVYGNLSQPITVRLSESAAWVEARFGDQAVPVMEGQSVAIVLRTPRWGFGEIRWHTTASSAYPPGGLYVRIPTQPWWTRVEAFVGAFETTVCPEVVSVDSAAWGRVKARYRG
ncbi:MAG: hypothetical protein U0167_09875 [bacterium]